MVRSGTTSAAKVSPASVNVSGAVSLADPNKVMNQFQKAATIIDQRYPGALQAFQNYVTQGKDQQLDFQNQALMATLPVSEAATTALNDLRGYLGLPTGPKGEIWSPEAVQQRLAATPGYQFQQDQARQQIERSAAARGGLLSGNTLAALQDRSQGIANQTYQQQIGNLAQTAGLAMPGVAQQAGLLQGAGQIAGQYGQAMGAAAGDTSKQQAQAGQLAAQQGAQALQQGNLAQSQLQQQGLLANAQMQQQANVDQAKYQQQANVLNAPGSLSASEIIQNAAVAGQAAAAAKGMITQAQQDDTPRYTRSY